MQFVSDNCLVAPSGKQNLLKGQFKFSSQFNELYPLDSLQIPELTVHVRLPGSFSDKESELDVVETLRNFTFPWDAYSSRAIFSPESCAKKLEQSMGAKNPVEIGLSYRHSQG